MKCIYKDEAGNRLFVDKKDNVTTYFAKNTKGELVSRHGVDTMMKEKGLSTKGMVEDYVGNKRKK